MGEPKTTGLIAKTLKDDLVLCPNFEHARNQI